MSAPAASSGASLLAAQLGAPAQGGVVIDFKLVDWRFGDFRKTFAAGATLGDVKRELVARHGLMARLDLFRDAPDDEHALPRSAQAEGSTLRELGCDLAQGFLFARAVPTAELAEMLGGAARHLRRAA